MSFEFTEDWFSSRIAVWNKYVLGLRKLPAIRVLEVGAFEGRATVWILQHLAWRDCDRVDCIDSFDWVAGITDGPGADVPDLGDTERRFWNNIATVRGEARVRLLRQPSADALCSLPPASYDFVYVDGSHLTPDVLTDAVLAFRCVRIGGLIALDDYELAQIFDAPPSHNDPKMAIDAFVECFAPFIEVLHRDYQVIVRRTG